jgi:GntR family transcriptional regulator, rspAB operon transcriptional repressor
VYLCAHNDYLRGVLEQHYMHALRIWFLALDKVTHLQEAMNENRDLLVAIRDGDADRAAAIMTSHVEGFEADVRRAI